LYISVRLLLTAGWGYDFLDALEVAGNTQRLPVGVCMPAFVYDNDSSFGRNSLSGDSIVAEWTSAVVTFSAGLLRLLCALFSGRHGNGVFCCCEGRTKGSGGSDFGRPVELDVPAVESGVGDCRKQPPSGRARAQLRADGGRLVLERVDDCTADAPVFDALPVFDMSTFRALIDGVTSGKNSWGCEYEWCRCRAKSGGGLSITGDRLPCVVPIASSWPW
jgi:hypothetical protein